PISTPLPEQTARSVFLLVQPPIESCADSALSQPRNLCPRSFQHVLDRGHQRRNEARHLPTHSGARLPMATLIRRHPLLAYYVLTFALSWGGFVLGVGPSSLVNTNWQAEGKFLSAVMVMLAGPSIAGLLLTGLVD